MQAKQKKFEMCTTENTQYDSEHRSTHITIIIVIGACMCVYVCVCVCVCVCNCMCGDTGPFSGHRNSAFTSSTQEIRDDETEIVTHLPNSRSFFFQHFLP